MKLPIILITYGFTQKLCTWQEDDVVKLPLFSEPMIATEFIKYFKKHFRDALKDKEELQVQVCVKSKYAFDMISMIGMVEPKTQIVYNATPLGEDPVEIISKISGQFSDTATVINKHYELDELLTLLADMVERESNDESAVQEPQEITKIKDQQPDISSEQSNSIDD